VQSARSAELDPAMTGLLKYLAERDLLNSTVVMCGGEFGRTPQLNGAEGRDHWPHGFSLVLAGGPLRTGQVIGQTDAEGGQIRYEDGIPVADVHATVLSALGIEASEELLTPAGRPMKLSEGRPIAQLL
jgi:uncharacterized protein (DUF1501 family)